MEYVYEYQFEKDRGHDYSDEFFEILQKRNHILKTKKAVVHKFHYFYYALAAVTGRSTSKRPDARSSMALTTTRSTPS